MYNYIIGKITDKFDNVIVVENNNIGYELFVSTFCYEAVASSQEEVKIYTYYQQKEDGVALYGFLSKEEKNIFLKLISVSGVGPKGAIAILSNITPSDLAVVIAKQDLAVLSKVKGVGKKTAERILVDLKDKIDILPMELLNKEDMKPQSAEVDDAIQVLISLGLSKQEATKLANNSFEKGDSAEDIIAKSLSRMK